MNLRSFKKLNSIELSIETQAINAAADISNAFLRLHSSLQNMERNALAKIRSDALNFLEAQAINKAILNETATNAKSTFDQIKLYQSNIPENVSLQLFAEETYNKFDNLLCSMYDENCLNLTEQLFKISFRNEREVIQDLQNLFIYSINTEDLRQQNFLSTNQAHIKTNTYQLIRKKSESVQLQKVFPYDSLRADVSSNQSNSLSHNTLHESQQADLSNPRSFVESKIKNHNLYDFKQISANFNKIPMKSSQANLSTTKSSKSNAKKTTNMAVSKVFTSVQNLDVKPNICKSVQITHFQSPILFFIQKRNVLNEYQGYCRDEAANALQPSSIKLNQLYLVQRPNDENWYRGKVLDGNNNEFLVFFVDYGFENYINFSKFREISSDLTLKPITVISCSFYGIVPNESKSSEEATDFMKEIISNNATFTAIILSESRTSSIHLVDLIKPQNMYSFSVRDAMVASNFAVEITAETQSSEIKQLIEYKEKLIMKDTRKLPPSTPIRNGYSFRVIIKHIISPDEFYGIKTDMMVNIENLNIVLNHTYNGNNQNYDTLYVPKTEMMCAAKINDEWYRGRIIKSPIKGITTVFLVDTGETKMLSWKVLRTLDDNYFSASDGVIQFYLTDINGYESIPFSSECIKEFEKLCKYSDLTAKVNKSIGQVYSITLSAKTPANKQIQINSYLVRKGLASSTSFISLDGSDDESNQLFDQSIKPQQKAADRVNVKIVNYISPSEFYINYEHKFNKIMQLQTHLQIFLEDSHSIARKSNWNLRDKCYVRAKLTKKHKLWYRGQIIQIQCGFYQVFLRDMGYTVKIVSNEDLADTHKPFESAQSAAVKCHLAFVEPANCCEWSLAANDKFIEISQRFENLSVSIPDIRSNDISTGVVLWGLESEKITALEPTITNWTNINCQLVYQGLGHLTESIETFDFHPMKSSVEVDKYSPMLNDVIAQLSDQSNHAKLDFSDETIYDLKSWLPAERTTKKTFTCIPTYIDDDLNIYLHEEQHDVLLKSMKEKISEKYANGAPVASVWLQNEPCMAKYADGFYYRAVVKMVNSQVRKCAVFFIDFGNIEPCNFSEMTKMIIFADVPTLAIPYRLINIRSKTSDGSWPINVIDFCTEEIVENSCTIRVHDQFDDINILPCSISPTNGIDLKSLLLSQNFAIQTSQYKFTSEESSSAEQLVGKNVLTKEEPTKIDREKLCNVDDYKRLYKATKIKTEDEFNFIEHSKRLKDETERQFDKFHTLDENFDFNMIPVSTSTSINDIFDRTLGSVIDHVRCVFDFFPMKLNEYTCELMLVTDPLHVVIAPKCTRYNKMYSDLLKLIQLDVQKQKKIKPEDLNSISTCLAFSKKENLWMRAIIIESETENKKIQVLFVDNLITDFVKPNEIRICSKIFMNLPVKYTELKLHGLRTNKRLRHIDLVTKLNESLLKNGKILYAKLITHKSTLELNLYEDKDSADTIYKDLTDGRYYSQIHYFQE